MRNIIFIINHQQRNLHKSIMLINSLIAIFTLLHVVVDIKAAPFPDLRCDEILKETQKPPSPSPIEINSCIEEQRSNRKTCTFDTATCEFPCRFGYELDENDCPRSDCTCAITGIFEGDIKFELEDIPTLIEAYDEPPQDKQQAASENALRWDNERVGGRVKVPYKINSKISSTGRIAIEKAIERYQNETCIDFVERDEQNDYLIFTSQGECWSYVGRKGGPQYISVGTGCGYVGVVQHELLHALGFWHEQSRPDRDSFVEIQFDNVQDGFSHNFNKRQGIESMGSPYDKQSIMHYNGYAFASGTQPTILDRTTGQPIVSQREGLSDSDRYQVNKMYKCNEDSIEDTQWTKWSQWAVCSQVCGGGVRERSRSCKLGYYTVSIEKCGGTSMEQEDCNMAECSETNSWSEWMTWSECSATCDRGYKWRRRRCLGGRCIGATWQSIECNTEDCSLEIEIFERNLITTEQRLCYGGDLMTGDFNGDQKADLLCVYAEGWTQVLVGTNKRYYEMVLWESETARCGDAGEIHVGDFNGDKMDDLICINRVLRTLDVTFSHGDKFNTEPDWSNRVKDFCQEEGEKILAADANGDGKCDLICKNNEGNLSVLINKYTT